MNFAKLNILLCCLSTLVLTFSAIAEPHEHQGIFAPFGNAPPRIVLSTDELGLLDSGSYVIRQIKTKDGGEGTIFQDIEAPINQVWKNIFSFNRYRDWVPYVDNVEVYEKTSTLLKADFKITTFGMGYRYFINHQIFPELHYLHWSLDYSRASEIDDVVGYWYLQTHPDDKRLTRVQYSVNIKLKNWVPGFIQSIMTKNGLIDATTWLKKVSESSEEYNKSSSDKQNRKSSSASEREK